MIRYDMLNHRGHRVHRGKPLVGALRRRRPSVFAPRVSYATPTAVTPRVGLDTRLRQAGSATSPRQAEDSSGLVALRMTSIIIEILPSPLPRTRQNDQQYSPGFVPLARDCAPPAAGKLGMEDTGGLIRLVVGGSPSKTAAYKTAATGGWMRRCRLQEIFRA